MAKRLVQRRPGVAVAGDAAALAERAVERLAEHDGDVLDGVVLVDPQVAGAGELEVEHGVEAERAQHVVEKADAGGHAGGAAAVHVDRAADVGLLRSPFGLPTPAARRGGRRPHGPRAAQRLQQLVVVPGAGDGDPKRRRLIGVAAHNQAALQQPGQRVVVGAAEIDVDEVRARLGHGGTRPHAEPPPSGRARGTSAPRWERSGRAARARSRPSGPRGPRSRPAAGSHPAGRRCPPAPGCSRPAPRPARRPSRTCAPPPRCPVPTPGATGRCRRTRRRPGRSRPARPARPSPRRDRPRRWGCAGCRPRSARPWVGGAGR